MSEYTRWPMRELLYQIGKHERVEPLAHQVFLGELADRVFRFLPRWTAARCDAVRRSGNEIIHDEAQALFAAMQIGRLR